MREAIACIEDNEKYKRFDGRSINFTLVKCQISAIFINDDKR